MDNKRQLNRGDSASSQKGTLKMSPQGSLTREPASKEDLKTSIERQRKDNKKKFQDPFFIKLDPYGDENDAFNMKIVKRMREEQDSDQYYNRSSISSLEEADKSQEKSNGAKSKLDTDTVVEANESEEQSPTTVTKNQKMQKSKFKKADPEDQYENISESSSIKTLPPLVKLDLNMDTLKTFLEDMQVAINDHAQAISGVQGELKRKANEKIMGHYLQKISEGLHKECGERPHALRLDEQNFMSEHYQSDDSLYLKRHAEKFIEKIEIIGLNLINFQKYKRDSNSRIEKLERQIPKCFTLDQFREQSQLQESRTMKYVNEQLGTFQENLNNYKVQLSDGITFFDKKVNDFNSETLWKIKDCEELLKSRVSDTYVNDTITALDEKFSKQLQFTNEQYIQRLEKSFKELGQRVIETNTFVDEKFNDCRKLLQQYDAKLLNVATMDKFSGIQSGYKDMKYNFERDLELIQDHVKDVKDKMGELSRRLIHLEQESAGDQSLFQQQTGISPLQHQSFKPSSPEHSRNQSNVDKGNEKKSQASGNANDKDSSSFKKGNTQTHPAQHHQSAAQTHQPMPISPIMRKRAQQNSVLNAELERKIQLYDEQIYNLEKTLQDLQQTVDLKTSLEEVKRLMSDKVSKEEMIQLLPNEEINQEKIRLVAREEVEPIQKYISDQLKQWDVKIVKMRQEFDIHALTKAIERKANEDQVRNDFSNHEFKISTLDRNLVRMANDFETFQLAINKLHQGLVELQDANRDVLLGKRTTNCLSCGKGGESGQTVKGRDGRVYKAEISIAKPSHQDQTSQFQMYDQASPNTGAQSNLQMLNQTYQAEGFVNPNDVFNMRPSHSFYENPQAQTEKSNLPSVHKKLNSHINFAHKNSNPPYSSNQALNNSASQSSKRKLPFGFQVQQEKKDLLKLGPRGKSSQVLQRAPIRQDHDQVVRHSLNNTFDE